MSNEGNKKKHSTKNKAEER